MQDLIERRIRPLAAAIEAKKVVGSGASCCGIVCTQAAFFPASSPTRRYVVCVETSH